LVTSAGETFVVMVLAGRHRPLTTFLRIHAIVFAVALGASSPSFAQGSQNDKPSALTGEAETFDTQLAPVVIDGEQLFAVRGVSAYPAARRARQIENTINTIAANRTIAPLSVSTEEHPGTTWILANGRRIMAVLDEDADLEHVSRLVLAHTYSVRIAEAIAEYRRARQPATLWQHVFLALCATLALVALLYGGHRLVHWLRRGLERRYRVRIHDLAIQNFPIVKAEHVWHLISGAISLAWAAAVMAMVFIYLQYTLALFPWTRGTARQLLAIAVDPMRDIVLGAIGIIPSLVFLAILFVVTRYLLKLVRLFFENVTTGSVKLQNFDPEWALPTYRLVRVLIIAFALVVAYPYIPGSETDAFKGISLFIGVIFSLGSSSLIGNLIAGYSMTYRRAFKIGDRVKVGEHRGEVIEMRLLATHLRSPKNEKVIIPSSMIVSSDVVNFSAMAKERGLILHTTVGIGYDTPWRQVEAMLLEAASRTPGLLREPRPFVLQLALGDFSVSYEINVYCDTPERMRLLYTELHRNILDVFNEYGVQIMTPAYENDPRHTKVVPKDRWYAAPARPPASPPRPLLVPKSSS